MCASNRPYGHISWRTKETITLIDLSAQFATQLLGALPSWCAPVGRLRIRKTLVIGCVLVGTLWTVGVKADVKLPVPQQETPVFIRADWATRWEQGPIEIYVLRGHCEIKQDTTVVQGREAVLWLERSKRPDGWPHKVIVYMEGGVLVDVNHNDDAQQPTGQHDTRIVDNQWMGRFYTSQAVQLQAPIINGNQQSLPEIYQRAVNVLDIKKHRAVRQAQHLEKTDRPIAVPGRRIRIYPRGATRIQIHWEAVPGSDERVAIFDSGVNLVVDGIEQVGNLDVSTDRLVIWTGENELPDISGNTPSSHDTPLEIYMEGNVVFRQGDRVIYARSMYYNVTQQNGVVLEAEALTPVPDFRGLLRLRAEVLQQLTPNHFLASNASITSSRIGVPRYWLQSESIFLEDTQRPVINPFTGQGQIDTQTGNLMVDHRLHATSNNSVLYAAGLPVFFSPRLATDLDKPFYYIDRFTMKNDSVFGTQIYANFDAYHLLGLQNPPEGTEWTLSTDYLSKRGPAAGTKFAYDRQAVRFLPGRYFGELDVWGIHDTGQDNLGRDRRSLVPEKEFRGRFFWEHRHQLPDGFEFEAQFGLISDRNFMEQFYEREWDRRRDATTGIALSRRWDTQSLGLFTDVRLNDFFAQTEWLPRTDHFLLGMPLLANRATWFSHSHIGYGKLRTAEPSASEAQTPLPWESLGATRFDDREGVRVATRHEIDLPLQLGPVKVVPYALGEAAHWGENTMGQDHSRLYGQTGIRASLPMWRADPRIHNTILNLNGLAHKVVFDTEFLYADANKNLTDLPLYDSLQDDSIEHFQRRFILSQYGGVIPTRFDDRFFALRSGLQSWVTSPSTEVADDLMLVRLGGVQRWQTKRGLPGQERVVDWITLGTHASFFPKSERDNFDQEVGLIDYDFRWHIGDRLTLLSDGFFDTFSDGLRQFTVGGIITRPPRGRLYLGFRSTEGPFTSRIIATSFDYRMTHKWIATLGANVDLGPTGNIGQSLAVTRVGESFLLRIGVNVDKSRGNVGATMMLEPRFLGNPASGRVAGAQIAPLGALGLE